MAQEHLDREISVEAGLDATGVRAKARSRFLAALDGLLGSVIDFFCAKCEGSARLTRARAEAREKAIQALGERARRDILATPAAGREGAQRLIEGERRAGGLLASPPAQRGLRE